MSVADIRQSYEKFSLLEESLAATPLEQFSRWFEDALAANVVEPNAMTLATTTHDGRPSARIVLLKGYDERGLVFFTNYTSRKGRELTDNPFASLLFFWPTLERQVRLEGGVEKVSAAESDEYFHSRPSVHASAPGYRRKASPSNAAIWKPGHWNSPSRWANIPRARSTGAATGSSPIMWNSGKGGRRACMTGWYSAAKPTEAGRSSGWHLDMGLHFAHDCEAS